MSQTSLAMHVSINSPHPFVIELRTSMSDQVRDTSLSGERLNEERAFIKRYTEGLASKPVEYPADYSTPLEDRPRKVAPVGVSSCAPVNFHQREC